jgi:hypothetical protein
MWAKFAAALAVGVILLVALVIFVNHNNTDSNQTLTPSEQAKVNREAARVVAADQAPHFVVLKSGESPHAGIVRTVHAAMASLVNKGVVDGPLQRVRCTRTGGHSGASTGSGRQAFTCIATADNVNYDFVGVVQVPTHRLTYCKRDVPPVPSQNIPISAACTA